MPRTHNLDDNLDLLIDAVNTSLTQGGLLLKDEMQRLAPVYTGRMMRDVGVSDPFIDGDTVSVAVGPTVDYAKYTELEPWIVGKRPGPISQAKGATIPWMRPATENVREEVKTVIENGIRNGMGAIVGRFHGIL